MSFVTHEQQSLVWLASPLLGGVRHGFSTRRGGVSPAPWDTLNLGPGRGDAPENVEENYRRFFAALDMDSAYPVLSRQVHREILRTVLDARVGVVQLPCPELCCLGLDRGDPKGGERPVVAENTRIRRAMGQPEASARLRELTDQVVWQIREYQKHGFAVLGIVGVDRSPCCGVNTTSDQDRELPGRGVFIASLRAALESAGLTVPVIGIKPSAPEALDRVRSLLGE